MYKPDAHSVYWLQLTRLVTLVLACFRGDGVGSEEGKGGRMNYAICDCNSPYVFCLFVCFGRGEREGEGGGGRGAGRMNCFVLSRSMYDCNSLGAWSEGEGGGACELCYTWLQLTLYLFWFFLGGGRGGRGGGGKEGGRAYGLFCFVSLYLWL